MKVGTKVMVVLIPPVLVLLVLAALLVGERRADVRETQRSQQLVVFVTETSELIHELQLERMWTAVFLASDGALGGEQVGTQRSYVQSEVGIFEEGIQVIDRDSFPTFNQRLIAAEAELARLSESRDDVDRLDSDQNEVFRRYDEVISSLLSATAVVAQTTSSPEASFGLVELSDLARAKESVASVTVVGSVLIESGVTGAESEAIGDQLFEANLDQQRDFERFDANGRSGSAQVANLLKGDDEIRWVAALDAMLGARLDGVAATDTNISSWTDLSTSRLTGLKNVHTELASEISVESENAANAAKRTMQLYILLTFLGVALALYLAWLVARATIRPLRWLTDAANKMAAERLPALVDRMRTGNVAALVPMEPVPERMRTRDEIGQLAEALSYIDRATTDVAEEQAALLRRGIGDIFVNLARRNQNLLDRQIEFIDELEANESDPDQLNNFFQLDHLATRMRRNAESLLVLAGEEDTSVDSGPVPLGEVIRVAVGEVEDFSRIRLVGLDEVTIDAQTGVDLAHLLSELMENATRFSPPTAAVDVIGHHSTDGSYVLTVSDEGIGMNADQLLEANSLLSNPPLLGLAMSRSLGFVVVSRLAERLGVSVRLTNSPTGGLTALVSLPPGVVGFVGEIGDGSEHDYVGGEDAPALTSAEDEGAWRHPEQHLGDELAGFSPSAQISDDAAAWGAADDTLWTPPPPTIASTVADETNSTGFPVAHDPAVYDPAVYDPAIQEPAAFQPPTTSDPASTGADVGWSENGLGWADGNRRAKQEPAGDVNEITDPNAFLFDSSSFLSNDGEAPVGPDQGLDEVPDQGHVVDAPTERPSRSLPSPEWIAPNANNDDQQSRADSFWAEVEGASAEGIGGLPQRSPTMPTTLFAGTSHDRAKSSFDQALAQILGGDDPDDVGINVEAEPSELPRRVRAESAPVPTEAIDLERLGWEADGGGHTFTESDSEVFTDGDLAGDIPHRPAAASLLAGVLRDRTPDARPLAGVGTRAMGMKEQLPPANRRVASSRRSPSQVRSMLSAYRSGIDRGRDGHDSNAENNT